MKTIFWNVDTQFDFMRPEGKLYVQDAYKIEPNLEKITGLAKEKQIVVVNTADWHNKDSKEISDKPDMRTTFPEHCMAGSEGAEFVPATKPKNAYVIDWNGIKLDKSRLRKVREIVLRKDAFDVFEGNPYADSVVKLLNPKKAFVYGVAANVCVNYAVLGLLEREVDVYVPLGAIKELPNIPVKGIYQNWDKEGAKIIGVNDVAVYI